MKANARLLDAWKLHLESPATFAIPSLKELMALREGDLVKLCVEAHNPLGVPLAVLGGVPLNGAERFWVRVNSLTPAPIIGIVGIVEQADIALTRLHGVRHGDTIAFEPCNIYTIRKKEDDQ